MTARAKNPSSGKKSGKKSSTKARMFRLSFDGDQDVHKPKEKCLRYLRSINLVYYVCCFTKTSRFVCLFRSKNQMHLSAIQTQFPGWRVEWKLNYENNGHKPWMLSAHVESLAVDEANVWKSGTKEGMELCRVPKARAPDLQGIIQRVDKDYPSAVRKRASWGKRATWGDGWGTLKRTKAAEATKAAKAAKEAHELARHQVGELAAIEAGKAFDPDCLPLVPRQSKKARKEAVDYAKWKVEELAAIAAEKAFDLCVPAPPAVPSSQKARSTRKATKELPRPLSRVRKPVHAQKMQDPEKKVKKAKRPPTKPSSTKAKPANQDMVQQSKRQRLVQRVSPRVPHGSVAMSVTRNKSTRSHGPVVLPPPNRASSKRFSAAHYEKIREIKKQERGGYVRKPAYALREGGNGTRKEVTFKNSDKNKTLKKTKHKVVQIMRDSKLQKTFKQQKAAVLPPLCLLDLNSDKALQEQELSGSCMQSSLHSEEDESLRHPNRNYPNRKFGRPLVHNWHYVEADPDKIRSFLDAHLASCK